MMEKGKHLFYTRNIFQNIFLPWWCTWVVKNNEIYLFTGGEMEKL